jgi:hypothetical protein
MVHKSLVPRLAFSMSLFVLLAGAAASAQIITGEIDGTVKDASGAVIPGAIVKVYNTDTNGLVRTITATKTGEYIAGQLQIGHYKVVVNSPGFQQNSLEGITLNVGDTLTEDVKLGAGATAEVTVTTDTDKPNIETTENSSLISNSEINELALNTRNFEQMLLLQPGVSYGGPDELNVGQVDPTGQRSSHSLSINGLLPSQVVFQLDGSDMLNHAIGGQVTSFPTIDAIAQIQTVRNSYGAQYGGGGSAQIIIVTKAGSADFHGGAYWFYRNAGLDATPIKDLLVVPQVTKPDIHYDDFGYFVGGPLFIPKIYPRDRSKSFFFFSQEFKRLVNYYANDSIFYPNQAQLNGYFAGPACIQYAAPVGGQAALCTLVTPLVTNSPYPGFNYQVPQPFNTISQEYIKDVINPSEAIGGPPNNPSSPNELDLQSPSPLHETQEVVRLDHQFSERLNGFVRYLFDPITQQVPNGYNVGGHGFPGVGNSTVYSYGEDFIAHVTFTAGPNTVVEGGFAYNPYEIKATPTGLILASRSPDVQITEPFPNTLGRIPTIAFLGSALTSSGPLRDKAHTLQAFENTTKSAGRHTIYFGVNFERFVDDANQGTLNSGLFNFNGVSGAIPLAPGTACTPLNGAKTCNTSQFNQGLASFLVGYPTNFEQASIDPVALPATNLYEAYVQDNWRATATLTVNAGVRYSIDQAAYDRGNHLGAFQPQAFNPANAPSISTQGNICTSSTLPGCAGQYINPAYNPLNGEVLGGTNSPYNSAVNRTSFLAFAPRVGFAWNVYGDGKTSLRGGYGIYFNTIDLVNYTNDIYSNSAYVQTPTYSAPISFANPAQGTAPANQVSVTSGINRNLKQPYTQSYSLDVQQQVGKYALVDVAYSGNQTQHLIGEEDLNQPLPDLYLQTNITGGQELAGAGASDVLNQIRPYLGYGPITFIDSRYFADYNSLQSSLTYRAGKAAVIGVHYTWSRAMSNSAGPPLNANGGYNGPQNRYNLAPEWGPTVYDKRNIFVAHFLYQVPSHTAWHGFTGALLNGYEVSGIFEVSGGFWFTADQNTEDPAGQGVQANGSVAQGRPNQISNPNIGAPKTITEFFNTAAFVVPTYKGTVPAGTPPGSAQIGTINGPGYATYNLDVFKNIELPENMRLQLRVEAFNFLNHVNYKGVGVVTNDANTYGQVTSFYDNRTMQVGAKFYF